MKWSSTQAESQRTREMLWDCPLPSRALACGEDYCHGTGPDHQGMRTENRRERTGLRAEPGGQSLLWREPRASYLWETLLIQRATRIRESTSLL